MAISVMTQDVLLNIYNNKTQKREQQLLNKTQGHGNTNIKITRQHN